MEQKQPNFIIGVNNICKNFDLEKGGMDEKNQNLS
jgi:hypothetical protein